jgi:excisionase family DNA binding protein
MTTTNTQDNMMSRSPVLTSAEVAELLQVPVRTLEQWRYKKSGPPYRKLGTHVRYQYSKVMDWFENDL